MNRRNWIKLVSVGAAATLIPSIRGGEFNELIPVNFAPEVSFDSCKLVSSELICGNGFEAELEFCKTINKLTFKENVN